LDERGYFVLPLSLFAEDLRTTESRIARVLAIVQTFEPYGIGARDLQECLLIQLRAQDKAATPAYQMVKEHFSDLLQGRLHLLQKKLKVTQEEMQKKILNEVRMLSFHPAALLQDTPVLPAYPDIFLKKDGAKWVVEVNEEDLPKFRLHPRYLQLLQEGISPEEERTLRSFMQAGKWLMRSVNRRRKVLRDIALYMVKKQQPFLQGQKALLPLSVKEIAHTLFLHESTVARAVTEKYIDTPFGVKPLRFFLSHAFTSKNGEEVSVKAIKSSLLNILEHEDKLHPYSDQELTTQLHSQGLPCARRTVSKYRKSLKISSKGRRKAASCGE